MQQYCVYVVMIKEEGARKQKVRSKFLRVSSNRKRAESLLNHIAEIKWSLPRKRIIKESYDTKYSKTHRRN